MYKTVVFDVDSTLVTIEGLVELARLKGVADEVAQITDLGMTGTMPFAESLQKRLDIVRPTLADMDVLGHMYVQHVVPGVLDTIQALNEEGVAVHLVTGSYTQALEQLGVYLDIPQDHIHAVVLDFDGGGEYVGFNTEQVVVLERGKRLVVEGLKLPRKVAMVGDGSTDLEVKDVVDIFVGFGGVVQREIVRDNADEWVEDFASVCSLFI